MKYKKNKYGDTNGTPISFWSTDDNILCEDGKTLRENLDEVDTQFKEITPYPILKWENNVTNIRYAYGDIRRYGAKCDGVTDDSEVIQWCLDNCCQNGVEIIIPSDCVTVVSNSLILKENKNSTWKYKIKSNHSNSNHNYILQKCKNLFIGERFKENKPFFTNVMIEIEGVIFKVINDINATCFKSIILYSSLINNCKFYYYYIVIEGSIVAGTKFKNNRIQGFKYAVLSSISIINDNHDFTYIESIFKTNYNINDLAGLLVQAKTTGSDYLLYSVQSNDGYFENNYIAGSTTNTYIPQSIFKIETIDSDFIINNNWFEFCKYVISPTIRIKNYTTSSVTGTFFNDNIFQYFHRFFSPFSRYASFIFKGNSFYTFNKTKMTSLFTNVVNDNDLQHFKSGVFITDIEEDYTPYMTKIIVNNNYFDNNDYTFFINSGKNGKYIGFTCIEQNSTFVSNNNSPYVVVKNTDDVLKIKLDFCNNVFVNEPPINAIFIENGYVGQTIHSPTASFICAWDGTKATYRQITI